MYIIHLGCYNFILTFRNWFSTICVSMFLSSDPYVTKVIKFIRSSVTMYTNINKFVKPWHTRARTTRVTEDNTWKNYTYTILHICMPGLINKDKWEQTATTNKKELTTVVWHVTTAAADDKGAKTKGKFHVTITNDRRERETNRNALN